MYRTGSIWGSNLLLIEIVKCGVVFYPGGMLSRITSAAWGGQVGLWGSSRPFLSDVMSEANFRTTSQA